MNVLLESPLSIIGMGTLLTTMLAVGWLRTGRTALLWGIALSVLLTVGLLGLEAMVVTTREAIDDRLRTLALDLEAGAHERVLAAISTGASPLRQEAERMLPRLQIHQARVKHNLVLEMIDADRLKAKFNAVLVVTERNSAGDKYQLPSYFIVEFVREGNAWMVQAYERRDPRDGIGARPSR